MGVGWVGRGVRMVAGSLWVEEVPLVSLARMSSSMGLRKARLELEHWRLEPDRESRVTSWGPWDQEASLL